MHELAIAQSLIHAAAQQVARHGAVRALRIELALGALAGVEPDALAFCFPLAAQQTVCEGAELRITVVPGAGRCDACTATCEVHDLMAPCPACGAWPVRVEGGREMTLRSLEVS